MCLSNYHILGSEVNHHRFGASSIPWVAHSTRSLLYPEVQCFFQIFLAYLPFCCARCFLISKNNDEIAPTFADLVDSSQSDPHQSSQENFFHSMAGESLKECHDSKYHHGSFSMAAADDQSTLEVVLYQVDFSRTTRPARLNAKPNRSQ